MMRTVLLAVILGMPVLPLRAEPLTTGAALPNLHLHGETGGRLDGTPWNSSELTERVHVLFYVDPDEKDLNEHVGNALKKEKFPGKAFGSVAIINMDATWKPAWLISKLLEAKQKQFPRTVYVKDLDRVLVRKWGLADDSYAVLAVAPDNTLLFKKDGKLSGDELDTLIATIRRHLP